MLQLEQVYAIIIEQETMNERVVNLLSLSNAENSSDNRSCKKAFTSFYSVQQMWERRMICPITEEFAS